jgi:hypothetical protein
LVFDGEKWNDIPDKESDLDFTLVGTGFISDFSAQ